MGRHAIENMAHEDLNSGSRNIGFNGLRTIGGSEYRLFKGPADLAFIDIEGRYDFYISGPVPANIMVHKPYGFPILMSIVEDTLYQRACTVPDTGDGNTNLRHCISLYQFFF